MDIINYSVQYINNNLREKRVMLIKSTQEFSVSQSAYVQKFVETFPSLVVNVSEVLYAHDNGNLLRLKELLSRRSEKEVVSVIFINEK